MKTEDYIITTLFSFVGTIIAIFIAKSIFKLPTISSYQRMKVRLLSEIALKNGVEQSKINKILSEQE